MLTTRQQQLEVECETKTKDDVFVLIRAAVQYKIDDTNKESIERASYASTRLGHCGRRTARHSPPHPAPPSASRYYRYSLENPRQQMAAFVHDVLRSSTPKLDVDAVFASKEEISLQIKAALEQRFSSFGFIVVASPITEIVVEPLVQVTRRHGLHLVHLLLLPTSLTSPPLRPVQIAMNEIQRQRRIKEAASDQGEVQKIQILKQAEADAAETTLQAKAEMAAAETKGKGLARQAVHISKALSRQVVEFDGAKVDMSERQVLDMMVMTQYVDTMKEIGGHPHSQVTIPVGQSDAATGFAQAVKKGLMAGSAGTGGAPFVSLAPLE